MNLPKRFASFFPVSVQKAKKKIGLSDSTLEYEFNLFVICKKMGFDNIYFCPNFFFFNQDLVSMMGELKFILKSCANKKCVPSFNVLGLTTRLW